MLVENDRWPLALSAAPVGLFLWSADSINWPASRLTGSVAVLAVGGLVLLFMAETAFVRVTIDVDECAVRNLLLREVRFRWSDVDSVTFTEPGGFVLRLRSGRTVRITQLLVGIDALVRALESRGLLPAQLRETPRAGA